MPLPELMDDPYPAYSSDFTDKQLIDPYATPVPVPAPPAYTLPVLIDPYRVPPAPVKKSAAAPLAAVGVGLFLLKALL